MTIRRTILGSVAALTLAAATAASASIEIGSSEIRDGAVQNRHIRPGAVQSPQIGSGQVRGRHAADDAFGGRAVREGSLDPDVLQRRIADRCPTGEAMVGAAASGSPLCELLPTSGPVPDSLPPNGPAGGDLTGTYPDPLIADGAIDHLALFAAALKDGPAGDAALRSLGTGATQAAAGDDARFPTTDEKAALAGTTGAPAAGNPYVTSIDPRLLRLPGFNVAGGDGALANVTTGSFNVAIGSDAAANVTTGNSNVALGAALKNLTTGSNNLAFGTNSLLELTTGGANLGFGTNSLLDLTTGSSNLGFGTNSLLNITTGNGNIALGHNSGANVTDGSSNILIGSMGQGSDNSTIRIGDNQTRAFLAGVRGTTTDVADAIPVLIDSNGQLGTISSSRRYKTDIAPIDAERARALLRLQPIAFHYKTHPDGPTQFGLLAEQVARVMPELAVFDERGRPETVAYQQLPALLLGEIKRQDRRLDRLEHRLSALERQTK